MKRIITYLTVTFSLLSCSFLDENLASKYSSEDIYGSEPALETAMYGCYSKLRTNTGLTSSSLFEFLYPASGVVHYGGPAARLSDGQQRWTMLLSFAQYSTSPQGYNTFKNFYSAIYLCNKMISELKTSPVDQTYKDQIEGEARFLRAVSYFYLVRQYGDIPMYLEPATSLAGANGKREKFWNVYGQIIKDLDFAEEHVRTYDQQTAINSLSSGRIFNHAATAMKSLVYLTIGTLLEHSGENDNFWVCSNDEVFAGFAAMGIESADDAFAKALASAKEVLPETTTTGSPYRLAEKYSDLFRWADLSDFQSMERIYAIPNTSEVEGSTLAVYTLPPYFNNTDKNQNYGRVRPTRWLFQKWCETYGGTKGSDNASNIYVTCNDPRLDASFIHTSYLGEKNSTYECYPNSKSILITSDEYKQCMPYYKKYYDPKYDASVGYGDLYVMRLAEVYLIAAEASANLGKKEDACEYVNYILARARRSTEDGSISSEPADWVASDFSTEQALLNAIFWERCFELGGEGHEYYDTHRMGAKWLSENIAVPHNAFLYEPEQEDFKSGTKTYNGYRTVHFGTPKYGEKQIYPESVSDVRKGLICAFPRNELTYNTELGLEDQNPSEIFWQ
jgi:hypothetical protein